MTRSPRQGCSGEERETASPNDRADARVRNGVRHVLGRLARKASSFFSSVFGRGETAAHTPHLRRERIHDLRLTGHLLALYVKPLANELHRKTPKGLKYLKESCSSTR